MKARYILAAAWVVAFALNDEVVAAILLTITAFYGLIAFACAVEKARKTEFDEE